MIGFISVEAQAEMDFDRACRRAFFGRLAARLRRECSRLLAFDEVGEGHLAHNRRRLGLRDVEVSKIVGSVGWQCGPPRGLRSQLHARECDPGGEVEEGGSSVPPRARFTGSQIIQDGGLVLR